jgi:TRAP-type C4-dicarboxylate transport system substrate-binding protein
MSAGRQLQVAVLAAAFALGTTACHGAGVNKAGGSSPTRSKPLTLTLLTGDSLWVPEFAAAVERLSHGSMRIDAKVAGNLPDYEAHTVEAVRAGTYQLGSVGARVWDAFGVTSLDAVLAPFLVDNLALEQRVLASPLATRMLAALDRAGVVGLALLPGPLRRPLGLSRPLVGPGDYRGATIAIRLGGVARATFTALEATVKGYPLGHLPPVSGAELDLNTITENGYQAQARALTANVVLWPRPQTIFANRAAFNRLTPAQQEILRRAGRESLGPELTDVEKNEAAGLAGICGRGTLSLLTASAAQLAALRTAVQPAYRMLERDPLTRELVVQIGKLRTEAPAVATDSVHCPRARTQATAASLLNGQWQVTASSNDLLAAGAAPAEAERQRGGGTLRLTNGSWTGREPLSGFAWSGRYTAHGNLVRLTTTVCPRDEGLCVRNTIAEFTWSVYDDRLSLALVSGTPSYWGLIAKPLTLIRR